MGVERFEDLIAWQKARDLAIHIYRVSDEGKLARDFGLRDQMRRASVSVMSNIAEGFERGGPAEFHRFLVIAKGSCAELRSQLILAQAVNYLTEADFKSLMHQASELSRVIGGLRSSVDPDRRKPPR